MRGFKSLMAANVAKYSAVWTSEINREFNDIPNKSVAMTMEYRLQISVIMKHCISSYFA